MKTILFFAVFGNFLASPLLMAGSADSIRIYQVQEVKIIKSRNEFYSEDRKVTIIGNDRISLLRSRNLGELLSLESPLTIKSYGGAGSLSTLSMRGTYANHTQVAWNGFPINSITTGDADLSLIPVNMAGQIRINHGAAGSLYGSGTFGGSIDILNSPPVSSPFKLSATVEMGSFSDRYYALDIAEGMKRVGFTLSAMNHMADNNFKFNDRFASGSPRTELLHNKLKYAGLVASVFYLFKDNSRLESGLWYQDKYKEIPEIMGSTGTSNANQKDSSFKVYVKYTKPFKHASLTIKTAWFSDYLQYTDKQNASDEQFTMHAEFFTRQLLSDWSIRKSFNDHLTADAGMISQLIIADVRSYGSKVNESRFALFGAAKYTVNRWIINSSLRNEWATGRNPRPLISIGSKYELIPGIVSIRSNISGKYRLPTLNEKYWLPGGNMAIRPEEGWSGEIGSLLSLGEVGTSQVTMDITTFTSVIRNMIQWTGEGASLRPENFRKVWTRGIETRLDYHLPINSLTLDLNLGYNYTLATNREVFRGYEQILGKQLRYVPKNSLNSMIGINYRFLALSYIFSYAGSAYISDDNLQMPMPAYALSHLNIAGKGKLNGCDASLSFRIQNLFNKSYQVMAAYPMPGRAYYLKLSVGLTKNNKDHHVEN